MTPDSFLHFDRFAHPEAFLLLAALPCVWAWRHWRRRRQAVWRASGVPPLRFLVPAWVPLAGLLPDVLRAAAVACLVVALARPQLREQHRQQPPVQGIDIVIALDVSRSMEAEDLKPNRLEAAKRAAQAFVAARPNDRIGLVIYSGEALTACPPTTQHGLLQNVIGGVSYENLEDGTAIGLGLATAVNRLKASRVKSKVVVLLTDGENNAGFIAPETAARMARRLGIKVYTVGVGKTGLAPFPIRRSDGTVVYQPVPFRINEPLLRQMAAQTGGLFYHADSREALGRIYREIDGLEKSKVQATVQYRYREMFAPWAWLALAALSLEVLLRHTLFRRVV